MSEVALLPLGGMGTVTQNMFVYGSGDELLIVDCGIGFPDVQMPGVDILIPDILPLRQLLDQGKRIVGLVLSHGHDDHIAALPYLLPDLPEFPLYASPLTAGFAHQRMSDGGIDREITVIKDEEVHRLSDRFQFQLVNVTHSVPDTRHIVLHTDMGLIYHGSDFKLDPTPVDGRQSDTQLMRRLGEQGINYLLIDCLRVERSEHTPSESKVGPVLEQAIAGTKGKVIVTLMSSHIHRIQQTIDAAVKHNRKVVFVGRSVEQNVQVALELNELHIPSGVQIDKRSVGDYPDQRVCIIIAGSQGQEGSSLMRAIGGEHPVLRITPQDKVVFSADAIPGNELAYYGAIDELSRNGVEVVYPAVEPGIHQSGHASAPEQKELVELLKPKFIMPIGGSDRHRARFVTAVAQAAGYSAEQVLIPGSGDVLSFSAQAARVADHVTLRPRAVDGLGVGDVGPVVLSDRRALSEAGIIVLVIPRTRHGLDLKRMEVVSRGFVFMKKAQEVVEFIKKTTAEIVDSLPKKAKDDEIKRTIERQLAKKLYKVIQREPLIVPVLFQS